MRMRAFICALAMGCAISSSVRAAGAADATASDGAPLSYLALHVTYTGFTDTRKLTWIERKAADAFTHAFTPIVSEIRVVRDAPDGEVPTYIVTVTVTRGDDGYRVYSACRQVGNPAFVPSERSQDFRELDPLDIEEYFRTTATVFGEVVRVTETPALLPAVRPPSGAVGNAGANATATTPPALVAIPPVTSAPATHSPSGDHAPPAAVVATAPLPTLPELDTEALSEVRPPATPWWRIGGWSAAGLAAGAFGVAVWQDMTLHRAGGDFRNGRTQLDQVAARARGTTAARRANIAFGIGAGCAVAGGTILILDYRYDTFGYGRTPDPATR